MYLENDMISVNGANVLAFSASIEWDIHRVNAGRASAMAGGLFNVSLRGTGYVAVTTKGDPVALDVSGAPTYADADAVVLWTSGVSMDVRVDTGGIKSMMRGGTGELVQMAFGGQGYVAGAAGRERRRRRTPDHPAEHRASAACWAADLARRSPGAVRLSPLSARHQLRSSSSAGGRQE